MTSTLATFAVPSSDARSAFDGQLGSDLSRDEATVMAALILLWSSQHLDNLWRLEAHLGERANAARAASASSAGLWKLRFFPAR